MTSRVYLVRFGTGRAVRCLASVATEGSTDNGWRQFVWTKDLARAEKFSCEQSARSYALAALRHDRFTVVVAPSFGRPTDDLGGTPVAMRMAA